MFEERSFVCPSAVHSHTIAKAVLVRPQAGEKTSSNIVIANDQVIFRKSHTQFINKDLELNNETIKLDPDATAIKWHLRTDEAYHYEYTF